jgi:hypothetical protein
MQMIDDEGAWTLGGFNLATQIRHQGDLDTKGNGHEKTERHNPEIQAAEIGRCGHQQDAVQWWSIGHSASVDGAWHRAHG